MSDKQIQADWLLRLSCAFIFHDINLVLASGKEYERKFIINHALGLLVAISVNIGVAFVSLNGIFSPLGAALAALAIGAAIYVYDLNFLLSDDRPKGVLADQVNWSSPMAAIAMLIGRAWARIKFIIPRIIISFILAITIGTLATLKIAEDEIEASFQRKQIVHNQPVQQEYERKLGLAKQELLGPLAKNMRTLHAERDTIIADLRKAEQALINHESQASQAKVDMVREKEGVGLRKKGEGAEYKDAEQRNHEAERQSMLAREMIAQRKTDLETVDLRIETLESRMQESQAALAPRQKELQLERDSKLMSKSTGIFRQYTELGALAQDSVLGESVRSITWKTSALLAMLELAFFMTLVNATSSNYVVRLNSNKLLEREQIIRKNNREILDIQAQYPEQQSEAAQLQYIQQHASPAGTAATAADHAEETLFDAPTTATTNEATASKAAPASNTATSYPVIGGKNNETVTLKMALANPDKYWVNPDRPGEIWDAHYYASIHDGLA